MKFLLMLVVVAIGVWMIVKRSRGALPKPPPPDRPTQPQAMVECAHCALHLPAADAVLEGSHVYCSEAHRRLGPRQAGT